MKKTHRGLPTSQLFPEGPELNIHCARPIVREALFGQRRRPILSSGVHCARGIDGLDNEVPCVLLPPSRAKVAGAFRPVLASSAVAKREYYS